MMINEFYFSIHGIGLKFMTSSEEIALPVKSFLQYFYRESLNGAMPLNIVFHAVRTREDIPVRISPTARKLFCRQGEAAGDALRSEWECTIYQDQNRLIADFHEQGLLWIDDEGMKAEGYLIKPEAMHPDIRVSFVHFTVTELLKRKDVYSLHATALEKNGRGVLIPGYSGRGKTTSFISLLRSGYRCLSDDHPFFRVNGKSLEILPFPLRVDVTEPTITFFPELREASDGVLQQGVYKRFFDVEDLYPGGTGESCEPAILVFPQVIDSAKSHLEPLSKSRALEEILPHGMLVYDPEVARREFQALSKLIQQVDCYRLHFGRDVLDLPRLITPLLETSQKLNGAQHSQVYEMAS